MNTFLLKLICNWPIVNSKLANFKTKATPKRICYSCNIFKQFMQQPYQHNHNITSGRIVFFFFFLKRSLAHCDLVFILLLQHFIIILCKRMNAFSIVFHCSINSNNYPTTLERSSLKKITVTLPISLCCYFSSLLFKVELHCNFLPTLFQAKRRQNKTKKKTQGIWKGVANNVQKFSINNDFPLSIDWFCFATFHTHKHTQLQAHLQTILHLPILIGTTQITIQEKLFSNNEMKRNNTKQQLLESPSAKWVQ